MPRGTVQDVIVTMKDLDSNQSFNMQLFGAIIIEFQILKILLLLQVSKTLGPLLKIFFMMMANLTKF